MLMLDAEWYFEPPYILIQQIDRLPPEAWSELLNNPDPLTEGLDELIDEFDFDGAVNFDEPNLEPDKYQYMHVFKGGVN